LFVLSNRVLFNFFTHNNLSKNHFPIDDVVVSEEKIKTFITLFLADDLVAFFSLKLSKNDYDSFEELDWLLDLKDYLPEEAIYKMTSQVFSKLDFALSQMSAGGDTFSNIIYIKFKSFYDLLSHFRTVETDQKISQLLSLIIPYYEKKINVQFFTPVIQSMAYYNAFDENIKKTLDRNRAAVTVFTGEVGDNKPFAGVSVLIGIICAFLPLLVSKCS